MTDSSNRMYFMNEEQQNIRPTDRQTWYALRTFNRQEKKVSLFLTEQQLQHFIPMAYSTRMVQPKEDKDDAAEPVKPILDIYLEHHHILIIRVMYQ